MADRSGKNNPSYRHGHSPKRDPSPTYTAWQAMRDRCSNPNGDKYHCYGGRGIKVCKRWLNSFDNFLVDLGERPGKEYSLDRVNNDGDYKPSNCRWATRSEQMSNKRTNRYITYKGDTKILKDWAESSGVHMTTIHNRIARGLPLEQVFSKGRAARSYNEKSVLMTYKGKTMSMAQWARESGLSFSTINYRIKSGLSPKEVLSKKNRKYSHSNVSL